MSTEKTIYSGNIISVTEERIGNVVWERAYLPPGVVVFPVTSEGRIILINELRPHETPPHRLKPVSGILEADKGSPVENAQREMQEEIGFRAREMELFLTLQGNGTVNHLQHFFIARGLEPSKLPNPDGEETILEILELELGELLGKFLGNEIRWSVSTLGFFKLYHLVKAGKLSLKS